MINIAINGFGRIGRMVFRAGWNDKKLNFVAINDLTDTRTLAHLLQYDSVHGLFPGKVSFDAKHLIIGKKKLMVLAEKDPSKLPWKQLKIDVVVESTGRFTKPQDAKVHLKTGARKVLLSAPAKCDGKVCPSDLMTMIVRVNDPKYNPTVHHIISNASCTSNCVAPILKVVQDHIGIKRCSFTTVHAYTADQNIVDGPHKDLRRARAAAQNIVPTTSGADIAVVEAIPSLRGRLHGFAMRVPVVDGSITDFTIETEKDVTVEQINRLFLREAQGKYKGIIEYSEEDLVSSDIIHNSHSAIFDAKLTNVIGKRILKLVAWYDNEWGYSSRVVEGIKIL